MLRANLLVKTLLLTMVLVMASTTKADFSASLGVTDGKVSSFYLAIGDHYRVPEKEIVFVKKKQIPDDELAVVFYLSTRAGVAPSVILDLRLGGTTWMDIALHYRLSAEIFYVAIEKASGPPYGNAHGYYRNRHRNEWKNIRLSDSDIVNLVNLKFVSEHFGMKPDEVARMREQGENFVNIHEKVKKTKEKKLVEKPNKDEKVNSKGKKK